MRVPHKKQNRGIGDDEKMNDTKGMTKSKLAT
jgi:hypothetical protein